MSRVDFSCQPWTMSHSRRQPRQSVLGPGSPSPLRPRKPPSLAIMRTAARIVGGCAGSGPRGWAAACSTRHSTSFRIVVQDASGFSRARSVMYKSRQATMENRGIARCIRFAVSN